MLSNNFNLCVLVYPHIKNKRSLVISSLILNILLIITIVKNLCKDLCRTLNNFHQGFNLPCSATVGLVVDVTLLLEEISVIASAWLVGIFTNLEVFLTIFFLFLCKGWTESSFDFLSLWLLYWLVSLFELVSADWL